MLRETKTSFEFQPFFFFIVSLHLSSRSSSNHSAPEHLSKPPLWKSHQSGGESCRARADVPGGQRAPWVPESPLPCPSGERWLRAECGGQSCGSELWVRAVGPQLALRTRSLSHRSVQKCHPSPCACWRCAAAKRVTSLNLFQILCSALPRLRLRGECQRGDPASARRAPPARGFAFCPPHPPAAAAGPPPSPPRSAILVGVRSSGARGGEVTAVHAGVLRARGQGPSAGGVSPSWVRTQ